MKRKEKKRKEESSELRYKINLNYNYKKIKEDMNIDNNLPVPDTYTVREAMVECGVNDTEVFEGKIQAERLATDLFGDDF